VSLCVFRALHPASIGVVNQKTNKTIKVTMPAESQRTPKLSLLPLFKIYSIHTNPAATPIIAYNVPKRCKTQLGGLKLGLLLRIPSQYVASYRSRQITNRKTSDNNSKYFGNFIHFQFV
jgi:hypothetical protein